MSDSKQENNKTKIFNAAKELFYEKGYTDTYVNDIVAKAGISKGPFYYYYLNKAELGHLVCEDFVNKNSVTTDMFPGYSELALQALGIRMYWHIFFMDEKIRRFINEIRGEFFRYKTDPIVDYCMKKCGYKINIQQQVLILAAIQGMRREIGFQLTENLEFFNADIVAEFTLERILQIFEFSKQEIKNVIKESKELLDKIVIDIPLTGFDWSLMIKTKN